MGRSLSWSRRGGWRRAGANPVTPARGLPLLLLAAGCAGDPALLDGELIFVRDAIIAPAGAGGQLLADGGALFERDWTPGESVALGGLTATAPASAECVTLFSVDLGDVARLIAMGGSAPDTALAFSPDGSRLAVGSYRGEVLVLDGWTGDVLARRRLAESMVKKVAWSPDGSTLYAGEQSPDAFVRALDPSDLSDRWTLRLADHVESSPAPMGEDLYGVYTLPGIFGLSVLPGGDLVIAASHGWPDGDRRRNASKVLRVSPAAEVKAAWPADGAADAAALHPKVDAPGGLIALAISRSADGPPPEDLPIGGVLVLDLVDLSPVGGAVAAPLAPWFTKTFIWEAVDASRAQDALLTGFGDGRVRVTGLDGAPRVALDAGAPVMAGEVPIAASVGHGFLHGDAMVFTTSDTNIPWGATSPELRPPTTHPNENAVWVYGLDGQLRWTWAGPQRLQGATLGDDGRALVVGAGSRETDHRRDLFGAMIFDLGDGADDGRSGAERLRAVCATEGPVFFRQALSRDGRLALSEHPFTTEDGALAGAYRVTVMR
jgi:hypothetical protein